MSQSFPSASSSMGSSLALSRRERPMLITLMGVMSIIVASLSLTGCLFAGLYILNVYRMADQGAASARSATASASGSTPVLSLPTEEELAARSAAEQQAADPRRQAVVEYFAALEPLSPEASKHLDRMLSLHGRKMLPPAFFTGGTISADDLRGAIVRHASPGEVLKNPNLPTTYDLAAGKLEVYRTHAVFRPSAGGTAIRSQATDLPPERDAFAVAQPEPPTTHPTGPTYLSGLNAQQVQSVIQQINKAAGQPMNPAQTSTMQSLLQSNKPQLVPPGYAYAAVRLARVNPNGGIQVWVTRVMIEMDVNGVASQMITTSAHKITLNPFAVTVLIGEGFFSSLVAILLLASAILLLRRSTRAATLHWLFIAIKLPLAVLAAAVFLWVMNDLINGLVRIGNGNVMSMVESIKVFRQFWLTMLATAAIYPLLLIPVLLSKSVREYYAGERLNSL